MTRDYELMYIVRPELDDDALRAAVTRVRGMIEAQNGEVVKTTLWGKRRLAYEVNHLRDGQYVLVVLHLDGDRVAPLERALRIDETVFRHLIVLHEGPMPEPDAEIEDVRPEGAAASDAADDDATVATPSAIGEQDEEDGDLDEVPSAVDDDEGDL